MMSEWVSVKNELPKRNETVIAKDDSGHVFSAVYFGPVIGWVNVDKKEPVYITHWAK